ncbi:UNVERIFIED_CONTAM: hypothetical protein GTU68_066172, partial [Idotea baltica]|nr:hypothetical protein [Idotea baltica]
MGRALVQATHNSKDSSVVIAAAIQRPDSPFIGIDVGEMAGIGRIGVPIIGSLQAAIEDFDFDVLIDFTLVEPTLEHLIICQQHSKSM